MRVLVTGYDGYIGSVLTPMLRRKRHHVIGLDTRYYSGEPFGPRSELDAVVEKDVRDVQPTDVSGCDAVIHLAALSNDPLGSLHEAVTHDVNHFATRRLAIAAKAAGATLFLYSSSCSVYGAANPDDVLDESAAFNPVTAYGISKVRAEAELADLADESFSPVFLRNATAYGYSPRLRTDLVVNNLAGWAYLTQRVLIQSDGTPWRPLVHVEDISRAFVAALEAPRRDIHNQAFNVGRNEENYQIRQLAELVREAVPGSQIEFAAGGGPDARCYRVNFDKIRKLVPAYRPQWSVAKGVAQLVDHYAKYDLTMDDFSGERFLRIKRMRQLMRNGLVDDSLRWTRREVQSE